jgi:hypothetical protein
LTGDNLHISRDVSEIASSNDIDFLATPSEIWALYLPSAPSINPKIAGQDKKKQSLGYLNGTRRLHFYRFILFCQFIDVLGIDLCHIHQITYGNILVNLVQDIDLPWH